jgi:hypothetical protein
MRRRRYVLGVRRKQHPHQEAAVVALASQFSADSHRAARSASPTEPGHVTGSTRLILRIEGFAAFAAALAFYAHGGFSWPAFALLFLSPDLVMLGYLAGPRIGAVSYNFVHTYTLALAVTLAGFFAGSPLATAGGLILIAHIGFDRALGFGLKYPSAFGDTHLGRTGNR